MKISVKSILEKCIWLLTVFLFATFLLFETKTWGKYAFFGATVMIVLMSAVIYDGKIRIRLQPYHLFLILLAAYCGVSAVWGLSAVDAKNKMNSLIQIFVCASMLYIHYDRKENIHSLLSAVKWAGYLVTLYAITFYGLDAMLKSSQDIRLDTEFSNVNAIAMAAAIACTFQWNDLMRKRGKLSAVMMIPAVILITATQSRKAFVLLLAGVFAVYIFNTAKEQDAAKKIIKVIFYVILMFGALMLLFQLPIFAGSLERMTQMLNFWTDNGEVDHSTILRNDMMDLGIRYWKEDPLFGVGMGSPHKLAAAELNYDAYLHNNFVEMLCGGGLVGFILYYSIYVYLFVQLFKYRKADREAFSIALVWLFLMLIMNYGMVTYYSKTQWYYLLIHFINVSNLKRKHREMTENAQEPAQEGDPVPDKL